MSKIDKKTKKEIRKVIRKYLGGIPVDVVIGVFGAGASVILASVDLILVGGLATIVGSSCLGLLGIGSGAATYGVLKARKMTNDAAQKLECGERVGMTLKEMEKFLRRAFIKATVPAAAPADKNKFLLLADEVEQDLKKLSPAFKIVSGAEKYEFIVDVEKHLTLDQARQEVKKLTPEQEEIRQLRERLAVIENPPVVRLDKKPPNP